VKAGFDVWSRRDTRRRGRLEVLNELKLIVDLMYEGGHRADGCTTRCPTRPSSAELWAARVMTPEPSEDAR